MKLFGEVFFICVFMNACSNKPETPEATARLFVRNYFFAVDRSLVLDYTSDKAQETIILENKYFGELNKQKSEIERPCVILLTDVIAMTMNRAQYLFSIQYEGATKTTQNMFVILKYDNNNWKVSDYRFARAGEE